MKFGESIQERPNMLTTIFVIIHIIAAVTLVTVILFFQQGKGAQIGSSFGGSSHTLFGSRGPANAMAKVTTAAAVIFMITSLSLSILSKKEKGASLITEEHAPMTLPVSLPKEGAPAPKAPAVDAPAQNQAVPPAAPVGPVDSSAKGAAKPEPAKP